MDNFRFGDYVNNQAGGSTPSSHQHLSFPAQYAQTYRQTLPPPGHAPLPSIWSYNQSQPYMTQYDMMQGPQLPYNYSLPNSAPTFLHTDVIGRNIYNRGGNGYLITRSTNGGSHGLGSLYQPLPLQQQNYYNTILSQPCGASSQSASNQRSSHGQQTDNVNMFIGTDNDNVEIETAAVDGMPMESSNPGSTISLNSNDGFFNSFDVESSSSFTDDEDFALDSSRIIFNSSYISSNSNDPSENENGSRLYHKSSNASNASVNSGNGILSSDDGTVTLSQEKYNELAHLALRGSELAENLAIVHGSRPCFKKIDSLCARMKQDLARPDGVLANINSQGIAWAIKDLIFVFTRIISAWIIIRGYVYNTPEGLSKVKKAYSPKFYHSFSIWQDATIIFVTELIRSFVNLDNLLQSQRNIYKPKTKNDPGSSSSSPKEESDNKNMTNEKDSSNKAEKSQTDSETTQREGKLNGAYFKIGTYNPVKKDDLPTEQPIIFENGANNVQLDTKKVLKQINKDKAMNVVNKDSENKQEMPSSSIRTVATQTHVTSTNIRNAQPHFNVPQRFVYVTAKTPREQPINKEDENNNKHTVPNFIKKSYENKDDMPSCSTKTEGTQTRITSANVNNAPPSPVNVPPHFDCTTDSLPTPIMAPKKTWVHHDMRFMKPTLYQRITENMHARPNDGPDDFDSFNPFIMSRSRMPDKLNAILRGLMNMSNASYFFKKLFTYNYFSDFVDMYRDNYKDVREIIMTCQEGRYEHIYQVVHDLKRIVYVVKEFLSRNSNDLLRDSIIAFETEFLNILGTRPLNELNYTFITGATFEFDY